MLASERTFAAWIRTALAAMAAGLAILRLIEFKTEMHRIIAHLIGEILILWGVLVVVLAAIDYKKVCDVFGDLPIYKGLHIRFILIVMPIVLVSGLLVWLTLP